MGVTLERRRKFCEKTIRNKEGRKFSLTGREWVSREFWEPASKWRVTAKDKDSLCESCAETVWSLCEWSHDFDEAHECAQCAGLTLTPILVVVLNLPRREGKTFNVAAFTLSEIFLKKNRNVLFLATAGDQTKMLFEDNWQTPIRTGPLDEECSIIGERITVPSTGSQFRYATSSSPNALAGGGVSVLVLDECRGLKPQAALSAIGSTRDQGGKECPRGHVNVANSPDSPDKCPACSAWLEPWYPLIVMTSSSGIETGTELDWFQNLVDSQLGLSDGFPVASAWTYRMEEPSNPIVQEQVTNAYTEFFSQSDALRPYVEVEMHNKPKRVGTDFVSPAAIKSAMDRRLRNLTASEDRCVGFLDTSTSGDLTSLSILCEDTNRSTDNFGHVYVARIDKWDPKKQRNGVIDPDEIREHIEKIVPGFPNLLHLAVDVRGSIGWPQPLVDQLRKDGMRFIKEYGNRGAQDRPERDLGWSLFEERILTRRITMPNDAALERELKGVHKKLRQDGSYQVVDRNRSQCHADITEGIASACLIIHRIQLKPKVAGFNRRKPKESRSNMGKYLEAGNLKESDLI